jgi:hypothetical protein
MVELPAESLSGRQVKNSGIHTARRTGQCFWSSPRVLPTFLFFFQIAPSCLAIFSFLANLGFRLPRPLRAALETWPPYSKGAGRFPPNNM